MDKKYLIKEIMGRNLDKIGVNKHERSREKNALPNKLKPWDQLNNYEQQNSSKNSSCAWESSKNWSSTKQKMQESFGDPFYIEPNKSSEDERHSSPNTRWKQFKDDDEPTHAMQYGRKNLNMDAVYDYRTSENHFYPSSLYQNHKRGRTKSIESEDTPAFN